jgi:hypothetical protein
MGRLDKNKSEFPFYIFQFHTFQKELRQANREKERSGGPMIAIQLPFKLCKGNRSSIAKGLMFRGKTKNENAAMR